MWNLIGRLPPLSTIIHQKYKQTCRYIPVDIHQWTSAGGYPPVDIRWRISASVCVFGYLMGKVRQLNFTCLPIKFHTFAKIRSCPPMSARECAILPRDPLPRDLLSCDFLPCDVLPSTFYPATFYPATFYPAKVRIFTPRLFTLRLFTPCFLPSVRCTLGRGKKVQTAP